MSNFDDGGFRLVVVNDDFDRAAHIYVLVPVPFPTAQKTRAYPYSRCAPQLELERQADRGIGNLMLADDNGLACGTRLDDRDDTGRDRDAQPCGLPVLEAQQRLRVIALARIFIEDVVVDRVAINAL